MSQNLTDLSRFIAKILRHDPAVIGITLEYKGGWADVDELIAGLCAAGRKVDRAMLEELVRNDEKSRYAFSTDGKKIHACQGHSFPVDMGYISVEPPAILFHGTSLQTLDSIFHKGLLPMERQYVHLSADIPTAKKVGRRKGKTVVLTVRAGDYHRDGGVFYCSDNSVWLTEHLPPQYIDWSETDFEPTV